MSRLENFFCNVNRQELTRKDLFFNLGVTLVPHKFKQNRRTGHVSGFVNLPDKTLALFNSFH